jgi:predicted nucleic acid-binding protein
VDPLRLRHGVFIDTSAWFALASERDVNHTAAARRFRRLAAQSRPLATTNHVVGETCTLVRRRLGSHAALGFLRRVRGTSVVRRAFVPEAWEEEAEQLLEQFGDQPFSYVDATSFVTMRRLGIREALAFDHDFLIAGFALVGDE